MAGPEGLGKYLRKHRIAFRLAGLTLLLSGAFATATTGVELVTDYNRDVGQIEQRISQVRVTYLPSLVASVWAFDVPQIRVQLEGIKQLPDIAYVHLADPYGHDYVLGKKPPEGERIPQVFPLSYGPNGEEDLGKLEVVGSTIGIYQRLTQRANVILLTQSLKALLLAFAILMLFRQLVTRHLGAMADYGRNFDPDKPTQALALDRTPRADARRDELDEVVDAVNGMRGSLEYRIDAQRQVERTLRAERNQLSTILATTGALVVMFDLQGRIVRFNAACEQASGRAEATVLGFTPDDAGLIPDEDVERADAVFRSVVTGGPPTRYQGYWLGRDGKRRIVVWSVTALRGEEGQITHCLASGIDITDLQDAKIPNLFPHQLRSGDGAAQPSVARRSPRPGLWACGCRGPGRLLSWCFSWIDSTPSATLTAREAAEELLRQMAAALRRDFRTATAFWPA